VVSDLQLADGDHVVQFYASADDHVRLVAAHLADALAGSATAIVVARSQRCDDLRAAIASHGVDVDAARVAGRYLELDAQDTLSRFMINQSPNADLFEATVGQLVAGAASTGPVRVYGEMVGLLWEAGQVAAAMQVEELWERLVGTVPFSLLCGYPSATTMSDTELDAFEQICRCHSAVLDDAPSTRSADQSRRFARSKTAPQAARQYLTETLRSWELDGLIDDAALVVSELATNAVIHAESDFAVGLSRHRDGVRIDVSDASPNAPLLPRGGDPVVGGRGLRVVASLSTNWGHRLIDGGKLVWAELLPADT
jgi:anti-sigma regulatory factor (Ser/Thr protein kinase)